MIGDLTLPVAVAGQPAHGTILATPDTATLQAGPPPIINIGDLLALVNVPASQQLPPTRSGHASSPRPGRATRATTGRPTAPRTGRVRPGPIQ